MEQAIRWLCVGLFFLAAIGLSAAAYLWLLRLVVPLVDRLLQRWIS